MPRLIFVLFIVSGLACGDTLTFTFTGTGSGHWGNQTFTNAAFTFNFFVPAADGRVQPSCCTAVRSTPRGTSANVTVAGFGTSAFGPGDHAIYLDPVDGVVGIWHYNLSDFLTVANPALTSWDLSTTIGPIEGTTFVYPWAVGPMGLAFTSVTNVSFSARRAPSGGLATVVSMNPAFGNSSVGVANAFQFTVADDAGAGDLQGMNILFSDRKVSGTGDPYACWLWFQRSDNTLAAYRNGTWQTARLGASGSILNGDNCTIDTAGAAATTDGIQITLSLPITFVTRPVQMDRMQVYVRAANNENVDSGYQEAGSFTLYPGASPNFMMNVTPTLRDVAANSNATYTVTVIPKPGFNEEVTLSATVSASNATAAFMPQSLVGAGVSTLTVAAGDVQENSSELYVGSTVQVSGTSSSGTILQDADLLVETHAPEIEIYDTPVSGTTHVYQAFVNDVLAYSNWATGIAGFNLLFAPSLSGQHACWMFYDGSMLWLANDDASAWIAAGPLGTTKTAQNSQCTVGGPAGSPGPRLIPYIGWRVDVPVTFSPAFAAGGNILWRRAFNAAGFDSGYFPWIH